MNKKNYKRKKERSSVTEDNENQRQATLKRLKRGDENELERNVPVSVYRVPVSVNRIPVSVYRVPVSVYLVPVFVYRVPVSVYHVGAHTVASICQRACCS